MMDNLDRCAIAAEKAGMSCGKYMAMKDKPPFDGAQRRVVDHLQCKQCGAMFPVHDRIRRKYCSDACRVRAQNAARRARILAAEIGE